MNLTDDEIRIKVAEACGWEWQEPFNRRKKGNVLLPPIGGRPCIVWRDGALGGNLPPNYPASVDAALTLCDRLRGEGWAFVADNGGAEWDVEFFRKATPHDVIRVVNPSLPKAICVAFLRIKES